MCGKVAGAESPASPASISAFFVDGGDASRRGCFDGEIPFPFPACSEVAGQLLDLSNDIGGDSVGCGDENGCLTIPLGDNLVAATSTTSRPAPFN
jgi:hypothetical protein